MGGFPVYVLAVAGCDCERKRACWEAIFDQPAVRAAFPSGPPKQGSKDPGVWLISEAVPVTVDDEERNIVLLDTECSPGDVSEASTTAALLGLTVLIASATVLVDGQEDSSAIARSVVSIRHAAEAHDDLSPLVLFATDDRARIETDAFGPSVRVLEPCDFRETAARALDTIQVKQIGREVIDAADVASMLSLYFEGAERRDWAGLREGLAFARRKTAQTLIAELLREYDQSMRPIVALSEKGWRCEMAAKQDEERFSNAHKAKMDRLLARFERQIPRATLAQKRQLEAQLCDRGMSIARRFARARGSTGKQPQ